VRFSAAVALHSISHPQKISGKKTALMEHQVQNFKDTKPEKFQDTKRLSY
jgi:hypothetical protein